MTGYRYKSVKNLNKSVKVRGYLLAEITVHRVKGIKNEVFISEKANASLRIIKNIDHDVSYAIKAYGGDVNKRPRIVVVAPEELKTGVFAKYDEINNTIYAIPQTGDRRKILELQKDAGGVCANNPKATMFHETWHWMQAQDYRKNVAPIQQNGHAEYMETVSNKYQTEARSGLTRLESMNII